MTYEELMQRLQELGSEQTKRTFLRHGAMEPLFGVKVGDLKKLVKYVKEDRELAVRLYASGNSDAMYLAGLSIDPKQVSKELLRQWADEAYWYMIAEYTVAGVAAESPYARELALEWIDSPEEMKAACGWSTYAGYVSITPDSKLPMEEIRRLLARVRSDIHNEKNRARYAMNGFVISVGTYVRELHEDAIETGRAIGKVHVDVGDTACKVPLAEDYIAKISNRGKVGVKKKTCIC
ncbi:DNA alkylation repair protein [Paenibacillus pinisoli]|uniref:DNA alkylation repair protein n=1 Tax=Paenibacillus pinisoli TaxID=1276110 RepID=A0A3A6PJX6_9BACL|nr:DNA alkylation repair protein [Paenibacillus pinisoli]RJX41595.1 DNA alkylation repair protein [Paenibacillus pinisoli]